MQAVNTPRHTKGSPNECTCCHSHRLLSFFAKVSIDKCAWGVGGGGGIGQQVRKTNNSTCLFLFLSVLDYIFVIEAQNNAAKRGGKGRRAEAIESGT